MKTPLFSKHVAIAVTSLLSLSILPSLAFADDGEGHELYVWDPVVSNPRGMASQYPVTWAKQASKDSLEFNVELRKGDRVQVSFDVRAGSCSNSVVRRRKAFSVSMLSTQNVGDLSEGKVVKAPKDGVYTIRFSKGTASCAPSPAHLAKVDIKVTNSGGKVVKGRLFSPAWNFGGVRETFAGKGVWKSGDLFARLPVMMGGHGSSRAVQIHFDNLGGNSYAVAVTGDFDANNQSDTGIGSVQEINGRFCGAWGRDKNGKLVSKPRVPGYFDNSVWCATQFASQKIPLFVNPPTLDTDYTDLSLTNSDATVVKLRSTVSFKPRSGSKSCSFALNNNGTEPKGGEIKVEAKSKGLLRLTCNDEHGNRVLDKRVFVTGPGQKSFEWNGRNLKGDLVKAGTGVVCEATQYLGRIGVGLADVETLGGLSMYDLSKDSSGKWKRTPLSLFWDDHTLDFAGNSGHNNTLLSGQTPVQYLPPDKALLSVPYGSPFSRGKIYSNGNRVVPGYRSWGYFNSDGESVGQNAFIKTYAYFGEIKSEPKTIRVVENVTDSYDKDGAQSSKDGSKDFDQFCNTGTTSSDPTDTDGDGVPNDNECLHPDTSKAVGNQCDGDTSDPDHDGKKNIDDTDSDGDDIPDAVECDLGGDPSVHRINGCRDTDNDGLPDFLDKDSDNDGIPDSVECSYDSSATGPGYKDGCRDTDSDNTPDYRDTDSDGDGFSDLNEGYDNNSDGITDIKPTGLDGKYVDKNNDGLYDEFDPEKNKNLPKELTDTDADGVPNYRDADADGDNIPDKLENKNAVDNNHTISNTKVVDADGDGVPETDLGDTDGDGVPDYLDKDSDDDGIPDLTEGYDQNGNTVQDDVPLKGDKDGNGLDDAFEGPTPPSLADNDGDGIPNYIDKDSDGDGIPDSTEGFDFDGNGKPDYDVFGPGKKKDKNHNGVNDKFDPSCLVKESSCEEEKVVTVTKYPDTDGDGVVDYLDKDSDGDGILDTDEAFDFGKDGQPNTKPDGKSDVPPKGDSNKDGIDDAYDPANLPKELKDDKGNTKYPDTDDDGVVNYLDPDSDNDNVPDHDEAFDKDGDGRSDVPKSGEDENHNGVDDSFDPDCADTSSACRSHTPAKPVLEDTDNDGIPNFLDPDDDGDKVPTRNEDPDQDQDPRIPLDPITGQPVIDPLTSQPKKPAYLDKDQTKDYGDPGHNPALDFKPTADSDVSGGVKEDLFDSGIVAGGCSSVPLEGLPAELPLLGLLFGLTWFRRRKE